MTPGGVITTATLAGLLFGPVARLADLASVFEQAAASVDRLGEILDLEPEVVGPAAPLPLGRARGLVEFDRVGFGYVPGQPVLWDVRLRVEPGMKVALVGPTGCGKSTLLNVAAGLLEPSSGTVESFGAPLAGVNARAGYMFQTDSLMPWRTALANVAAGFEFRGASRSEAASQAQSWLKRVGLAGFGDRYPHQLSGGMRKRTSLAQTLALDPDIILMDEPFSALDVQTRQLMENEVLALWAAKKKAVLFITHDLDEAIAMSDRVVVLSAGPGSHPIGEFTIDLERPRDVAEVRTAPRFIELHQAIWSVLRDEVLKGYAQQLQVKAA
jgi:NitT/TauT family transport system ATP-binding protein